MFRLQISAGLKHRGKDVSQWFRYGGSALCALFLSNVRLLGGLSPFGAAFAMALPSGPSSAAVLGGILGYALLGKFEQNLPYLIAMLCILAFKLAFAGYPRLRSNPVVLCTFTTAVLAVTLTVTNALNGVSGVGICIGLAESALGGAMTYFCLEAVKALESISPKTGEAAVREPGTVGSASLAIVGLVALIGVCGLNLSIFNFGRMAGAFLLLWIANRKGAVKAAASGVAIAAALALYSPSFALSGGILALSAMLCGYFASFGRLIQVAMFIVVNTVGVLVTGGAPETLTGAFDVLIASAAFMLLPNGVLVKLRRPGEETAHAAKPLKDNKRLASRFQFASRAIEDIRDSVDAVSKRLTRTGGTDVSSVYEKTSDRVCRRCGLKMFCWETAFSQTNEAFQRLTPLLKANGKITKAELPPFFQSKCPKLDEIVQNINGCYHEFVSHENAGRKVLGAKQVALEQLEGIAEMLRDAGKEMQETELSDPKRGAKVRDLLYELGEEADEVYCVVDRYDRLRIEIYREKPFKLDKRLITDQLSELLERPFDRPCVVTAGDLTKICFFEQAQFTLDFAASQQNAGDNQVSGDCYEYFADPRGFAHMILSDGMGSGGRAAVDSIMTCSFVLKLIKAGFGFDAALKFINSALLVKAGDESLATLDIGCIDLYTGTAEFLKAGGACSFVCRNGRVTRVSGTSLPAGILEGIRYDRHTVKLLEGDIIVMVTDGAIPISEEWFEEELVGLKELPAAEIAQKLSLLANRRQTAPGDDITVVAARMVRAG